MSYDLGTAHGKIVLDYNGEKAANQAENDIDRLSRKSRTGDKDVKRLGKALGSLGKGVSLAGVVVGLTNGAAQAAALAVQVAGIVPQLVSVGSLAAGLPALLVGAGAAAGVLKASLLGVGDALKAAFETDPKKFEEALKKLSPAARDFAQSVRTAAPELKAFQQGLQDSFFESGNFQGAVTRAVAVLGTMTGPLKGLASQLGEVGRKVTEFALSAESIDFVNGAVARFRTAIDNVSPSIVPLLAGLRSVGVVGLPLMDRLSTGIGNVAEKFGAWLSQISADGRLQTWIDTAISTLGKLGGILANVGSIFNSIFQAAGATGGGLLGVLQEITGKFAEFLSSAEGSEAIRTLFAGILKVASQLAPVITTLVGALAGPLGSALGRIATELGPILLQTVEALAPAFGPLTAAIADLLIAVAPLIPPIAKLVSILATALAGGVSGLASALGPTIEMLSGGLLTALQTLAPVIEQALVKMLPIAAEAGTQLATALAPLVPAIVQFASALTSALLPYLPQLMANFQQLVPPIVQIATIMSGQLAGALMAIIPHLPKIIGFLVGMSTAVYTVITSGLKFFAVILQLGKVLMNLPAIVSSAIGAFKNVIVSGFNAVVDLARQFPFRVGQAIGVIISVLVNAARAAWNALRSAFSSGVSTATGLARTLPGKIASAISNLPSTLSNMARNAWNSLKNAFSSGISGATSLAHTLPGRIRSAVGNLGSLLVSAGADAIRGLVNGIKGAIGSAIAAAASAGRAVISGIKSTLKISSPSKEMIKIGRFVTQGLVKGLLGTAAQVKTASDRLANMVRDAFIDKKISKSRWNSVLSVLSQGSKTMLGLINRSNSIAARLKTAQASLAAVQKNYTDTQNAAAQKVRESFSLIGGGQNFLDLDTTKQRLRLAVQQAKDFAADIAVLAKRGLNKDLISQLVAAGAQEAGAMADALAKSGTNTIREFNALQGQLNASANQVGKTAADALYGAGLRAAQGLVNGLASQQRNIEALMLRIAKSMEKSIKKALKIKSPSRIMFNLGKFISSGLALGIEALRKRVEAAAQGLASASIMPTVQLAAARPSTLAPAVSQVRQSADDGSQGRTFGPYNLLLDGGVITSFVVDAITGNPKVVSKSASEGDRQNSWSGSGRKFG